MLEPTYKVLMINGMIEFLILGHLKVHNLRSEDGQGAGFEDGGGRG